jgi:polyhydroxyalkanoate synthesis regulator protein
LFEGLLPLDFEDQLYRFYGNPGQALEGSIPNVKVNREAPAG